MTSQTRATLKGYFNTNDQPTEAQFADLIDSAAHVDDFVNIANIPTNGLLMRLDANDVGVGAGMALDYWISHHGMYLSATGTERPTLQRTSMGFTVRFNGTSNFMSLGSSALTVAQPNTIVIVASLTGSGDLAALVDGNDSDGRQEIGVVSGNTFLFAGESVTGFSFPAGIAIIVQHWNNSASYLRINGAVWDSSATGTNALKGMVLGAFQPKNNLFWGGDISDVLLYNRKITTDELEKLEYILASKNGLSYRQLVFDGDSRTLGSGASSYCDYPSVLQRSLNGVVRMRNTGIGGYPVSEMVLDAPARIDSKRLGKNDDTVILLGGVNDIVVYGGTPEQVYANLKAYWAARRAAGWKVVACTEIDANSALAISTAWRTHRATLNTMIRSDQSLYDVLVDLAIDSDIGVDGAADSAFFTVDKIHPSDAGYTVMASLIKTAIESI